MRRGPVAGWLAAALLALAGAAGAGGAAESSGLRVEARSGLPAEIAALLVGGGEGGTLHLAAAALPERAVRAAENAARFRVPVVFEVPAVDLAGAAETVDLYLYAVDASGGVAGHLARRLVLGEERPAAGVKLDDAIDLPAGAYTLQFMVHRESDRRWGLVRRQVTVGDGVGGKAAGARLTAPRVAEACGGWRVLRGRGSAGGAEPAITARPVLVDGRSVGARSIWRGAGPAPERVELVLEPRAGGAARRVAVEVVERRPRADGGFDLELALELPPEEVAQGIYTLALETAGEASPAIDAWVVSSAAVAADGEVGCAAGWSAIAERAAAGGSPVVAGADERDLPASALPERAVAPSVEESAVGGARRRQLERAYLATLARIARAADVPAGAAELAALEAAAFAESPLALKPLRAAELAVAGRLARRDGEALVPVFALHAAVYRRHFEAGRFGLASHSREIASALLELLAPKGSSPGRRRLTADLATGMAVAASGNRMAVAALTLLERAIAIDPTHESARLQLAVNLERLGAYVAAIDRLEELVALDRGRTEARLRLACLLERVGWLEESERLLRGIVDERPRPWELSLAYQTLGRVLGRRGRFEEAAEIVRHGTTELPDDRRLRLLRAYLLDRAGRRQEGMEILAGLSAAPGRSPRWRYAEVVSVELARIEAALAGQVSARMPRLAEAVAGDRR